jgi:ABC-type sugar transport system ATPase subunit
MTTATPALQTVGLDKTYPGVHALAAVDFSVDAGEIVGLVGKNGAGKSTLIKIAAGAVSPDHGELIVAGEPVTLAGPGAAREHGLTFIHQELNLVPALSVAENLGLGAGYPRRGPFVDWRALRRRAAELLARVQLDDLDPRTPASELTAVEQRQVMIAAALWTEPSVLVLDEPTASLTDHEITRLHEIIRDLRDQGVGIVYVSHRLEEVLDLADRIVVMMGGAVVAEVMRGDVDKRGLVELISGSTHIEEVAKRTRSIPADAGEALRTEGVRRAGRDLGMDLLVRYGEIVGVAGLAGSGRTSLLRGIYGAAKLDAGKVWVDGKEMTRQSPRRSIAQGMVMLAEDRRKQGLLPNFSVTKNITLPVLSLCRRMGAAPLPSPRRERKLAADFIDRLSIKTPSGATPVTSLSGGNQQKVLMARWLAVKARVFLLDEPTIGIDVEAKEELYALVRELADDGAAMVVVCSDFAELAAICDRVYVISHEGQAVGELRGDEVSEERIVRMCFGDMAAA